MQQNQQTKETIQVTLDEKLQESNVILLVDDGIDHHVVVILKM